MSGSQADSELLRHCVILSADGKSGFNEPHSTSEQDTYLGVTGLSRLIATGP